MIKLNEEVIGLLNEVIQMEIEHINRGFNASELLGKVFLENTIKSFVDNYLKKIYGDIIPQYSSEYRYFIVGILKQIDDDFKELALCEILIPTVQALGDEELLLIIKSKE